MANNKEAQARIRVNKLLEEAGWRFFDTESGKANIQHEPGVPLTKTQLDDFGNDFEQTQKGYIDYLLLDAQNRPIIVIEAKKESIHPLDAKEQARTYAHSMRCRFIILTNGVAHYFWDIEHGNPQIITEFPTLESLEDRKAFIPNKQALADEDVDAGYIARIKDQHYADDPRYIDEEMREDFLKEKKLIILRPFQVDAIHALQAAAREGQERYLFEMATGTGKTLTTAAVSRLFLQTGNAKRILFLVDRIELEEQAEKSLKGVLGESYIIKVFKRSRDDWRSAQIVISTVQSLLAGDRYRKEFSPTDFDLVISDEAHRSLGGNSRAVFEYFNGYKLGLTATPRDYLKNVEDKDDPRSLERRELLDTYRTFGCESGMPTFRYDLSQGAKDGYLVQPRVFDARTDITTKLLSEEGYHITITNEDGEMEETFTHRDYEKKFFNTETNIAFCKTFLEHAMRDPISGEMGKSLIFCVSQKHARKITEILNLMADKMYPGKYNSDFAMQVTSLVASAQDKTVQFSNNTLGGRSQFRDGYKTAKTRVCVTVGMMTTGYDCPDVLNLALMRPIFSPSDFVQMKGRGTRKNKFIFENNVHDKSSFYLFDFFGNYEYFEEKFDYDAVLELPAMQSGEISGMEGEDIKQRIKEMDLDQLDEIAMMQQTDVDEEGMRIDRELYHQKFEKTVQEDENAQKIYEEEGIEGVKKYVFANILNRPKEYFTPERLRKSITADRWVSFREMLQKAFGEIDEFPKLDEKTEEEFRKFQDIEELDADVVPEAKWFFASYLQNKEVREVIQSGEFAHFNTMAGFDMQAFRKLANTKRNGVTYAQYIPTYVHDYIENIKEFERV